MGDKSGIEWTDATWNPIVGCSKVSPGCANCYAETLALRWGWTPKPWLPEYAEENVILKPDRLDQPLRWKKARRVFVNSLSDLFHEQVPYEFIDKVFAVMALSRQHTFQILTKRPERMREYMNDAKTYYRVRTEVDEGEVGRMHYDRLPAWGKTQWANQWWTHLMADDWPLKNVWLGTSVENARWRTRIDELRNTPAAVRFLSCEPLLGPLVPDIPNRTDALMDLDLTGIDWVIVGGESGAGARPMKEDWVRDIVASCELQGVAPFVKQFGDVWSRANLGHGGHGGDIETFPDDLKVREYPATEKEMVLAL